MEALFSKEHDASPSWYGYEYQRKCSILIALKKMNSLYNKISNGELNENEINKYILELECVEDFSILKLEQSTMKYEEVYQVKAKGNINGTAYKIILKELLVKYIEYDKPKTFLISKSEINTPVSYTNIRTEKCSEFEELIEIVANLKEMELDKFIENLKHNNINEELKCEQFQKIRLPIIKLLDKYIDKENISFNDRKKYLIDNKEKKEEILEALSSHLRQLIEDIKEVQQLDEFYEEKIISENEIDEKVKEEIKEYYIYKYGENSYRIENGYLNKAKNALYLIVVDKLENKIFNSKKLFQIKFTEIIECLKKEKETINELHLLFLLKKRFNKYKSKFCNRQKSIEENLSEIKCSDCNISKISNIINKLRYESFKKFLFNSNVLIDSKIDIEENYSELLQEAIILNFVLKEIFHNKNYEYNTLKDTIVINHENEDKLLTFIIEEDEIDLKYKLDDNFPKIFELIYDYKYMINKNLNFNYKLDESRVKNQYETLGNMPIRITEAVVNFISCNKIRGN